MSQLPPTPSTAPRIAYLATVTGGHSPLDAAARGADLLEIETQPLLRNFHHAVQQSTDATGLFQSIFAIIADQTECLALWRVQAGPPDQPLRSSAISDDSANALWVALGNQLTDVVRKSESSDQICSAAMLPDQKHIVVAAPLDGGPLPNTPVEILTGCFAADGQSSLRLQWLLGIAAQSVNQWVQLRQTSATQSQAQSFNEALQLIDSVSNCQTGTEAAITIVNALRRIFRADQIAMAIPNNGNPKLLAISDVEKLDVNSDNHAALKSAITQSLVTQTTLAYPSTDPTQPAANVLPLKNWCDTHGATSVFNVPMTMENGDTVGALLVTYGQSGPPDDAGERLEKMAGLIAKQFNVVRRANRSTSEIIKAKIRSVRLTARKIAIVALLLAGLMAIPWPYRVPCDCNLQPTQRRFVAAPYSGILEQSLVSVGDVVEKDQVIARLDGRQLRIELAGLQAEYEGAKRRRESSLAQREIAQSQIARSEMKRLSAKIQLLNNRMQDLQVRSPTSGVIVAGDMDKAQGAPLEMGQTLFEVAPLDTMVAEIGIPENEIQYVKKDDWVALKINSFPFQNWAGRIGQIHPSAEIVSDSTVFIAEVEIENPSGRLRPGMEGSAKISTHWSPIGWNLFHNAWESVRYWTIW